MNKYELIILASHRAREINKNSSSKNSPCKKKETLIALSEIYDKKIDIKILKNSLINSG